MHMCGCLLRTLTSMGASQVVAASMPSVDKLNTDFGDTCTIYTVMSRLIMAWLVGITYPALTALEYADVGEEMFKR